MAMKSVVLVGADGYLGPPLLNALDSAGSFSITVLKRASSNSKSAYPPSVQTVRISDNFPREELVTALQGKDAVVFSVRAQPDLEKRIADAAVEAGVKLFIPGDFGSCDSQDERVRRALPLYEGKAEVRRHVNELAAKNEGFSWTSLVCGHFFDVMEFLHVDLVGRKMDILDDGETPFSVSTLGQVGLALVKLLEKGVTPETKNKIIHVHSFCVTQNQVVAAFERATGQTWKKEMVDSKSYFEREKAKVPAGDPHATERAVWVLGTWYTNYSETNVNKTLGLPEEDLDEVVKQICA